MEFASALMLMFAVQEASYCPFMDRSRFPPDEVLWGWEENNKAYQCLLREKLAYIHDPLSSRRPFWLERGEMALALQAEINEAERIRMAMWWVYNYPNTKPPDHIQLRLWMRNARRLLTPLEYNSGSIPWGGMPAQSR